MYTNVCTWGWDGVYIYVRVWGCICVCNGGGVFNVKRLLGFNSLSIRKQTI